MEPIRVPITDNLDLHTFRPAEVAELLDDYFEACIESGIYCVKIIHGKGTGRLKQQVHSLLGRHPRVGSFRPAPPETGGWGATIVDLCRN